MAQETFTIQRRQGNPRRKIFLSWGEKYGRLTLVEPRDDGAKWLCKCQCGLTTIVAVGNLTSGHTKSCGCLSAEKTATRSTSHKEFINRGKGSPEYRIWAKIKGRCLNPKDRAFKYYGGRGISICDEWQTSFAAFLRDVGRRPSPELTLDRTDNNKGYAKDNCRWATRRVQSQNRRCVKGITLNGRTQSLADWSRETGISIGLLFARIRVLGWTDEQALTTPVKSRTKSTSIPDQQ
jgi:hypothetical protein